MANPFCHVELNTDKPAEAKKFYSQLLEWKMEDMAVSAAPTGTYTVINVGEGVGGGIFQKPMGAPTTWLPYVQVDSVDSTIKKARELGAKICVERKEVADMGAFGIFIDPWGAMLGVWENAKK